MTATPGSIDNPLPRRAARVLLIDAADRVLMFRGIDPQRPGHQYWFTVGGGLDPDESPNEGAARELREETGLAVDPAVLGEPVWHEVTDFPFDGRWYRQDQDFFLLRVDTWEVSVAGHDEIEQLYIEEHRWWSVADLSATQERYYPGELPTLLRDILYR